MNNHPRSKSFGVPFFAYGIMGIETLDEVSGATNINFLMPFTVQYVNDKRVYDRA